VTQSHKHVCPGAQKNQDLWLRSLKQEKSPQRNVLRAGTSLEVLQGEYRYFFSGMGAAGAFVWFDQT